MEHAAPPAWANAKRAAHALEFLPPLVVVAPEIESAPVPAPPPPPVAPILATPVLGPALAPVLASEPAHRAAPRPALAETVAWAGFACLVSAGVVSGGQGERAEAIWMLSIGGGALSIVGLVLLGLRHRRTDQSAWAPQ